VVIGSQDLSWSGTALALTFIVRRRVATVTRIVRCER
jgi:hypothetical protein